jgi:hypothetical protein
MGNRKNQRRLEQGKQKETEVAGAVETAEVAVA